MTDVYIYDAIRTPRGKGRKDGSLHEVTALRLSSLTLNAIQSRNNLSGHAVEDVIWGNVTQVGEQGACLARSAVLASDLDESIPGLSINRFCASGLEAVNLAANQVRGGAGEGEATQNCGRKGRGAVARPVYLVQGHASVLCRSCPALIGQPRRSLPAASAGGVADLWPRSSLAVAAAVGLRGDQRVERVHGELQTAERELAALYFGRCCKPQAALNPFLERRMDERH